MATPTWNQIILEMIARLTPKKLTGAGAPAGAYLRELDRYYGQIDEQAREDENAEEILKEGAAGRTPAMYVAFAGEKPTGTTVGRRIDRVEGTFTVVCVTDSVKHRRDRGEQLDRMLADARYLLGGKVLGALEVEKLRYAGVVVVLETRKVMAWGVKFTTEYNVDFTKDPGSDLMLSSQGTNFVTPTDAEGEVKDPTVIGGSNLVFP